MMGAAVLETSGDGFDVVRDLDHGKPSVAALPVAGVGETLVTVGEQAGESADAPLRGSVAP
jgi:hypothetical protein